MDKIRYCRWCGEEVILAGGSGDIWIHVVGAGRICYRDAPGAGNRTGKLAKAVDEGVLVVDKERPGWRPGLR